LTRTKSPTRSPREREKRFYDFSLLPDPTWKRKEGERKRKKKEKREKKEKKKRKDRNDRFQEPISRASLSREPREIGGYHFNRIYPVSGDTMDLPCAVRGHLSPSTRLSPPLTPRSDQPPCPDAKYPARTMEYISFENLSHAKSSTKGNWIPVRGRDGM
jgi:hypothetical protein